MVLWSSKVSKETSYCRGVEQEGARPPLKNHLEGGGGLPPKKNCITFLVGKETSMKISPFYGLGLPPIGLYPWKFLWDK